MYKEFFGMSRAPFSNQIASDALYISDSLAEVVGSLCYVAENQLFGVLPGNVGVGKSTIIRRLKSSLSEPAPCSVSVRLAAYATLVLQRAAPAARG